MGQTCGIPDNSGNKVNFPDKILTMFRILNFFVVQALLSAHDTVAQKDYEPVLPPMPDELPDDEEATRIVCLVKNKQPLVICSFWKI